MWNNLEHQIHAKIKQHGLEEKNYLCCVSGGVDSILLLRVLLRLNKRKNIKVLHYHHGVANTKQGEFRNAALALVKDFCEKENLEFCFEKSARNLFTEAEMRAERLEFFAKYKNSQNIFLTAHHEDDVLETRLLKMLRGTGVESLLAFSEFNGEIFRPFYTVKKQELLAYAQHAKLQSGIDWCDDPSNFSDDYLRNWLRNTWLTALEQKSQGSVANFAKSLDRLISEVNPEASKLEKNLFAEHCIMQKSAARIDRVYFATLSTKDQTALLVYVLNELKIRNFSLMQIKEILKRLDKNQNEYIFSILSAKWVIDAQQIVIELES